MLITGAVEKPVVHVDGTTTSEGDDLLAVEEPLEIQAGCQSGEYRSISITMRTPGDDIPLAAGFLYTEGILRDPQQVASIEPWGPLVGEEKVRNIVRVSLRPGVTIDWNRLDRHFYTSSSCGVCGKSSIASLHAAGCAALPRDTMCVDAALLHELPSRLRAAQDVFAHTGGLHAAALFSAAGELLDLQEDVGRHNAVDKLIGARFLAGELSAADCVLLVSGRASFELVQKAAVASIPMLAAIGAPSSLAVELATTLGMTLAGFVRHTRFNLYAHPGRVRFNAPCDKKELE